MRVIGYTRVSTEDQADSGLGLEATERAIHAAVDDRDGWRLVRMIRDPAEYSGTLDRPGLIQALELMVAGRADVLLVAKLDRLTRQLIDFAVFNEWLERENKHFVALDFDVDTTTPAGRFMMHVMVAFAQFEREQISARTRAALGALRARGQPIGRPAVVDRGELAERIRQMRDADGMTMQAIADQLNADGVATIRGGGQWRKSSLQAVLGYKRPPRRRKTTDLPSSRHSRSDA